MATALYTARIFVFDSTPEATIAAGYDQFLLERRTAVDHPWTDVTARVGGAITIKAGTYNYSFLDDEAEVGFEYRPVIHDSTGAVADIPQAVHKAVDAAYEQIMTIDELKQFYLFGLDLTNDDGVEYPDSLYAHYIQKGIADLEMDLDIKVTPTHVEDRYDWYRQDYQAYGFVKLKKAPVIQVEEVSLEYPAGSNIITFDPTWIRLDREGGTIQILPARGTFTQFLISAAGGFLPIVFGGADYIPDLIKVTYFAGFAGGTLPANLKDIVGKFASMGPLNIAGDLLGGAGIASQSISIDGLSQSFNTTSSATNAGYGARLIRYDKEIKDMMPKLRTYYRGLRLVVV